MYLLQCWQAEVIADRVERVWCHTESKLQEIWQCSSHFGESSAVMAVENPKGSQVHKCSYDLTSGWLDWHLGKDVFIFHSAYREVGMGGRNGVNSLVQWYALHWQGTSIYCSGGYCWLFSLFRLLRGGVLFPIMEEGWLGKEVHFYILIARTWGKGTYPLPFLLNTLICICAKAGFFDFFVQIGYFVLSLSIMSF